MHLQQVDYTSTVTVVCKFCGKSKNVVKNGMKGNVQDYLFLDCGHAFAGNKALPGIRWIAMALRLFYEGLSLDKIRRELDHLYHVYPFDSTVYDWVVKYTKIAVKEAKYANLKVGEI